MTSEPENKNDEKPEQDSSSASDTGSSEPTQSSQVSDTETKDDGGDDKKSSEVKKEDDAVDEIPEVIKSGDEAKPVKPKIPDVPVRGTEPELWLPKTKLGKLVKDGEITNISDALKMGLTLREPEIVDILLPDLEDEVLDVNMVQRMTDSGRRVKFAITTVVGNQDGYVGLGHAKGKEVGPAIRKAIDNAKINIMEIKRGCGSWECGCGKPHSLPFGVKGKSGSVEVFLKPAPRGIELAVGNIAKHVLRLAGIEDAWGSTRGSTRTTVNYSKAIIDALKKTSEMKISDEQMKSLHIAKGALGEIRKDKGDSEAGEDEVETGQPPVADKPPEGSQPPAEEKTTSSEPEPKSKPEEEKTEDTEK